MLAAGRDLDWSELPVSYHLAGCRPARVVRLRYDETALIVSADHLFLMPDGSLERAERLSLAHRLVRPDGTAVEIIAIELADVAGHFHQLATAGALPLTDLGGCLLVTNGVVSAADGL